jgi:hypothetical protein
MDINILVRPVYGRQRTQSIGISELNVSYALCVPMGIHIRKVSLYAGTPNLDTLRNWSVSRLQLLIERSADRSLCHTFVALSDLWILTFSLNLFMDANEHNPLVLLMLASLMCAYGYIHKKGRLVRRQC